QLLLRVEEDVENAGGAPPAVAHQVPPQLGVDVLDEIGDLAHQRLGHRLAVLLQHPLDQAKPVVEAPHLHARRRLLTVPLLSIFVGALDLSNRFTQHARSPRRTPPTWSDWIFLIAGM